MTLLDSSLLTIPIAVGYLPFVQTVASKRLVVYGAGGLYASFEAFVLSRYKLQPDLVIDRKYAGSTDPGQVSPDQFFDNTFEQIAKDDLVVICLGDIHAFVEVRQRFLDRGFSDVRSAYDIYEYNLIYAGEEFARDPVALYRRDWDQLARVYGLLHDQLSKDTYYKFLRTHVERLRPDFAPASYPVQYTPPDIPLIQKGVRLLNCGAYNGDTIENFIHNYGGVDFVCALEPDPENFAKLACNEVVRSGCGAMVLLPLGASNENSVCMFENGNGMISRVSNESSSGASMVQVVKLDSILIGLEFNKVVIDTEGHEIAILQGMQGIIQHSSPDLCIACYHYPEDIYRIALLIESFQPKYKFYLRNHSSVCVDTVLYATLQ